VNDLKKYDYLVFGHGFVFLCFSTRGLLLFSLFSLSLFVQQFCLSGSSAVLSREFVDCKATTTCQCVHRVCVLRVAMLLVES
jgi:hypothetical protein